MPEPRLRGKVAIVTGAGSGLGQSFALGLAREGAAVAVCDVDEQSAEETVRMIVGEDRRALAVGCDVSRWDHVGRMVEIVVEQFGAVDVLVNNAGVRFIASFSDHSEDIWRKTIDVNLTGAFLCAKAVVPFMLQRGKGKIVNVASTAGVLALSQRVAYCASKAGIIGLTRALAFELSDRNIYVNAIAPGVTETPGNAWYFEDEETRALIRRETPIGRWGRPDDHLGALVFLTSDESDFVCGAIVPVDGGWTAGKGY